LSTNITNSSAPATPAIMGLIDHSVSNYADFSYGSTLNDDAPGIVFMTVPGDTYSLYDNGTLIGTMVATSNNTNWTVPSVLFNGAHTLALMATDAAGNNSATSSINFTVTAGPAAPTLLGLIDHSISNYAEANIALPTHDANPSIVLNTTVGDTLNLFDNGHLIGSMVVTQANTKWDLPTLTNGVHDLSITETSKSGTSVPLFLHMTIDAPVAPATPSIFQSGSNVTQDVSTASHDASVAAATTPVTPELLGMIDHTVDNNWNFNPGELSNDPNPTVVLTAKVGDTLTVFDNGVQIGTIVATSEQVSWTLPTLADGRHSLSIAETNAAGTSDPLILKLTVYAEGSLVPADTTPNAPLPAPDTNSHTAVGLHDAFVATADHQTADLSVDPATYFKQSTAHIEGGASGVHTLHLEGSHQVLDLTSLTGKTAAAKISGIEVVDLGDHGNTLNLSIVDVLNLGQTDLFQYDGNKQMMVNGSTSDTVDLLHANVARVADTGWEQHGTASVGGVVYNVYEHEGAQTELLIQQSVHIVVH
jgi:hypothetical protein